MNIAFCGLSCTGKSTLATQLAECLVCEVRGCGTLVNDAANRLGVRPEKLPPSVHNRIDAETLRFANLPSDQHRIIEGRYLHYVLSECVQPTLIIELIASTEIRLKRWQERLSMPLGVDWLQALDLADKNFVEAIYQGASLRKQTMSIDTSQLTIVDSVDLLLNKLSQLA